MNTLFKDSFLKQKNISIKNVKNTAVKIKKFKLLLQTKKKSEAKLKETN